MSSMHDWYVKAAPLVNPHTVSDGLSRHSEHGRVMADEDDAAGGGKSCLDYTNDVGNGQTGKQRPHGEVLKSGRGRRELIAERVILHVDPNKIVQSRCGKRKNSRNLLGVEEVGSFVPVNPHPTEIITQQVVEGISRKEGQAVRNPVSLIRRIVEV